MLKTKKKIDASICYNTKKIILGFFFPNNNSHKIYQKNHAVSFNPLSYSNYKQISRIVSCIDFS